MKTQTANLTEMSKRRAEEFRRAFEIVKQLSARCERLIECEDSFGNVFRHDIRHDLACVALQGADMQDCFATIRELDAKIVRAGNAED